MTYINGSQCTFKNAGSKLDRRGSKPTQHTQTKMTRLHDMMVLDTTDNIPTSSSPAWSLSGVFAAYTTLWMIIIISTCDGHGDIHGRNVNGSLHSSQYRFWLCSSQAFRLKKHHHILKICSSTVIIGKPLLMNESDGARASTWVKKGLVWRALGATHPADVVCEKGVLIGYIQCSIGDTNVCHDLPRTKDVADLVDARIMACVHKTTITIFTDCSCYK